MLDFSESYFKLFGLSVGYTIDMDELADRYRDLQRVVHPDHFVNAPDLERRLSMQGATHINEAYETLKDPMLRARYLLLLNGIDMDAQQETTGDVAFLMEQLELREELAEVREQVDPYAAIAWIMAGINKRINTLIGQMTVQFETATREQLEEAREILCKMQFMQKLRHDAESIETELDEAL